MPLRSLRLAGLTLLALVVGPSCAAERRAGPEGSAEAIVRSAPDRTVAATTARVEAAAPDARSRGTVRLGDPARRLEPRGSGAAKAYPELVYPLVLVDLVRGAVAVESYGGVAVRGVSTFRYETVVNVERALATTPEARRPEVEAVARMFGAPAFYADVWVDDQGRLRRVQVPVQKTTQRPESRDRRTPRLITVDFFDFEPA